MGVMIVQESTNSTKGSSMEITAFHDRLLWARRHHARITQRELADRMKKDYDVAVGSNYISEIELDKGKKPSFEVVRAMAGTLGVSLDWLASFSEEMLLARGKDGDANYFSAEADEVARMVDEMHPAQRATVLNVARGLAAQSPRQAQRSDIQAMLNSVERDLGLDARRQVEKIMRGLGMLHDPDA